MFLISQSNIVSFVKTFYPLIYLSLIFNFIIFFQFNTDPSRPDELWYVENIVNPDHNLKLMFRFFHFYTAKLFYPFFSAPIETAKFMSLFYANIIVVMTYLTGRFVSINSAFFATVFVMFNPTLLYQSTWFGTDLSMTALGLLSMFFYFAYLKYKHKTLIMLSGFFLIASIFSKQTGIVFSLPIIILISINSLNNKNNLLSSLVFLTLGGALCLLYISLCSLIFNNDFFYFINPQTYLEFLERFDNQLTNDSIKKIKRMPTYLDSLINTSPISILYFIGSIFGCTFLALSQIWNFQHNLITKNVIMFTFILFLSVLFLHEIFHISFYGLRLHPRYLLPAQICVAITFGALISLYIKNFKMKNYLFSKNDNLIKIAVILISTFISLSFINNTNTSLLKQIRWVEELFVLWTSSIFLIIISYLVFAKKQNNKFQIKSFNIFIMILLITASADGLINSKYMNDRKIYRYLSYNSALSKIEKCNSFDLNVELKKRDQVNFFEYLTGKGILSSSTYLKLEKGSKLVTKENKINDTNLNKLECKILTETSSFSHLNSAKNKWIIKKLGYSIFLVHLDI